MAVPDDTSELAQGLALSDVLNERAFQRIEFSDEFDDTLEPAQWIARIVKFTGRAVSMDPAEYRKSLVVVGALALAAIEAHDRRTR